MKLRKAIEITVKQWWESTQEETYPFLFDPTDTKSLSSFRKSDRFVSERVVYRLSSWPLWNYTRDGSPF